MFQIIEGRPVYVVDLPEILELPITMGGDFKLLPYARALSAAIREGVITKPGKYAIELTIYLDPAWNVYAIKE